MPCVVQKYGGSSVSDLDKIRQVAQRIARTRSEEGVGVVAVVSAMGHTTQQLISLAEEVAVQPDRRELDMLISVGERITMALLAMALGELGVPARSLTGSQSGIITDENHAAASVVAVRPDRIQRHLDDGEVVIVAGFQGVSREREITTLGRGGSDTTAVVLAAALQARWCEICSDVDGVWSADPRVVPQASRVDEMGLDEALALARGGAKVLFEDAVRYARDEGVQILASSTFGPGSGTRLVPARPSSARPVGVTSDEQLRAVRGPSAEVVRAMSEAGARLRRRRDDLWLWDTRNAHGHWELPEGVVDEGAAAVATVVGSGVGEQPSLLVRAEEILHQAGIDVRSWWASGDAISAWVAHDQLQRAVALLHEGLLP